MRQLLAQPAYVETRLDGKLDVAFITSESWLTDEAEALSVTYTDGYSVHYLDVRDPEIDEDGTLTSTTVPNGLQLIVRSVTEDDCVSLAGLPDFPTPVPVIAATLNGDNHDTHIEALLDDDGWVNTLMLVTDVGFWVRYGRKWHPLLDIDLIRNLSTIIVEDTAVALFDPVDTAGQMLHITKLPNVEPWPPRPPE